MKIGLLLIGNEILDGSREDINAHLVIQKLKSKNLALSMVLIVRDEQEEIARGITFMINNADFIITSGGLGLTPDDVTLKSIARGLNKKMVLCKSARKAVERSLKRLGKKLRKDIEDDFSYCIEGAEIIENEVGVAPVEKVTKDKKVIYILPGVPAEFSEMFTHYVLNEIPNGQYIKEITIKTACNESDIVDVLRKIEKDFNVKTSSYPPVTKNEMLTIAIKGGKANDAFKFFKLQLKERGIRFEKDIS